MVHKAWETTHEKTAESEEGLWVGQIKGKGCDLSGGTV